MRKIVFVLLMAFVLNYCAIHLGEGNLNLYVDHTQIGFVADSATVILQGVKVHLVGHNDVDLNIEPLEVNLASPSGVEPLGTFELNSGSYDRITVSFAGAKVIVEGQEFDADMKDTSVTIPLNFEIKSQGEVNMIIRIEGTSFIYRGPGDFEFEPQISLSVQ